MLAAPLAEIETTIVGDDALAANVLLDDVRINGVALLAMIEQAVTACTIERTIEGASTLSIEVYDPQRTLLNAGLLDARSVAVIGDLRFSFVQFSGGGNESLTLTFEDEQINKLRRYNKPLKATRGQVTRAQFLQRLAKEASVSLFAPEAFRVQPVGSSQPASAKGAGFSDAEKFKVRGKIATKDQRKIVSTVLALGNQRKLPRAVMIAAVAAMIKDTSVKNKASGTLLGVFAQRKALGSATLRRDVKHAAGVFYDAALPVYRANPGQSIGALANAGQRNAGDSSAKGYAKYAAEAKAAVKMYFGGDGPGKPGKRSKTIAKPYSFTRGQPGGEVGEDSWACMQRLADEVGWRVFAQLDRVWFASEPYLFEAKPVASIDPNDDSFIAFNDYDFDAGKKVAEASFDIFVGRWSLSPGSTIVLTDSGPLNGRWLVTQTSRDLFSPYASVTVKRPRPTLPEPPPETETITVTKSGSKPDGLDARIDKAYKKAQQIHAKKYPYVWGGGHGKSFAPTGGGYDCSGSVSAVLGAAGLLSSPRVSGALESWGVAGEGKLMTVWTNDEHVFIEFNLPGKGRQHFGTGNWGKGWGGAGFNPRLHPHAGFTARHWKGL